MSIITLTTDYGLKDHFVGAIKGKIISEYSECQIVDISHQIDPFNISEASYLLSAAYSSFPKGTVHIVGVDIERNKENQHIAMQWDDHFFICADNGILSMLIQKIVPQKIVAINIHDRLLPDATDMDVFIKVILRTYGGLFEQYVAFREEELARNAKLDERAVRERLTILKQHNIIDYIPRTDDPRLTFLTPRMHEEQLIISEEIYEHRKRTDRERMQAMIRFIERHRCRSVQLLEYFGEKEVHACGMCDVCRDNQKHGLSPADYEMLFGKVTDLLIKQPMTAEKIMEHFHQYPSHLFMELLRWKLDNGDLEINDDLEITLPGWTDDE